MEITKEEIAEIISDKIQGEQFVDDWAINQTTEAIYPIIEALQSENTALKRKVEILEIEKEYAETNYNLATSGWNNVDVLYAKKLEELEAKLTLLKAEQ